MSGSIKCMLLAAMLTCAAIIASGDKADDYVRTGLEKEQQGRQKDAIADFTKAIKLRPDYAEAYNERGQARHCGATKGSDCTGAFADYNKAIELKPDLEKAYVRRAFAKFCTNDLDGSIADSTKAIELKPDDSAAYNTRAIVRKSKGDIAEASADQAKADELRPPPTPGSRVYLASPAMYSCPAPSKPAASKPAASKPVVSKTLRGDVSPFAGNKSSDLVTVHLNIVGGINVQGSIFDNGTIVMPNTPPKAKGQQPCGADATDCAFAPGAWLRGKKQLIQGNELGHGSIFFPQNITWRRLPGSLVIRFYVDGNIFLGVNSGTVTSDEVTATAGNSYSFALGPERIAGGTTIQIKAQ